MNDNHPTWGDYPRWCTGICPGCGSQGRPVDLYFGDDFWRHRPGHNGTYSACDRDRIYWWVSSQYWFDGVSPDSAAIISTYEMVDGIEVPEPEETRRARLANARSVDDLPPVF